MPEFRRGSYGMLGHLLIGLWIIGALAFGVWLLQRRDIPPQEEIKWGASFSKLHADELGLDWRAVYRAMLDNLMVPELRLSAHWPMIEPARDRYSFEEMDYQMDLAREKDVRVILALGRKAPGWPECHVPQWIGTMPWDEQKEEIKQYITAVVDRYRDYPNLRYWQVENEPFLNFAREICGKTDEAFLEEEINLVRALDPDTPILVTDGGEFGTWYKAHQYGDSFGSTMYLYVYTRHIGYWRYPVGASFFRFKLNMLELLAGQLKPVFSMEVGLEPWLHQPIRETPLEEQLERMSMERFEEIVRIARRSGFSEHYLWGAEWWYYMREHGHPEFWNRAKELYAGRQ